jgi:hypothetical protein
LLVAAAITDIPDGARAVDSASSARFS